MIYYIIGILAGIFALTVFFSPKKMPPKQELKTLNETDFVNGIRNLARENRIMERGSGLNLKSVVPYLDKANRIITQKAKKNLPLTEGEKWYYDNINYVKRFAYNYGTRTFARLPASDGGIRILTLARYIVQNSLDCLDYERIRLAIDTVNKEVALTYEEVISLRSAIGYAMIEFIYILSRRLIHFNRMQRFAKNGQIMSKHLKSDIYLHFALKGRAGAAVAAELEKMSIQKENISLNYAKSVVETTRMARFLFDGIRNLGSLISGEEMLALLTSNRILCSRGPYKDMSFDTRNIVLSAIADISERINISETHITRKLMSFAEYNDTDICTILFNYRKNLIKYTKDNYYLKKVREKSLIPRQVAYIAASVLIAAGLSLGSYFLFYNIALTVILYIPFLLLAQNFLNFLLEMAVKPRPLPQMAYKTVPSEHSALVVVSEYITNADQMKRAIRNIKVLRAGNPDKNIYVSLLADFKPSDSPEDNNDAALIAIAKEAENEPNLIVFVRKRTKIGKRYQAYERKRGAVMALARLLVTGNKDDFSYISVNSVPNFEYIVALDADNTMPPGSVKEMVNIIAHPANKKYDLIAARSKYNLFSINTPFSKRFIRESAFVNYPNYSSLYYNCFGVDIFCGKGIFRVKQFYNKLDGIFPDNKLLSHDIIEGAVLTTASGYIVYEDAPKNFIADRERRKRWQRGDIQFLPFLGKHWKNKEGERYASEISPIYKFLMASNVLDIISPILIFAAGIIALVYKELWPLFVFAAFAPLALEIFAVFRNAVYQRYRPMYLFCDLGSAILNYIIEFGLLPYYVFSNLQVLITTLWRMAANGNLLEWKTYYQSQTQGGKFAKEVCPSMLILPVAGIALMLGGAGVMPLLIFAVFSYLVYLGIYLSGYSRPEKTEFKDIITGYAEKTYGYFKYMRKEGSLIADNLQIKPYKGMSSTTSPTNIGMQIIAEISARCLGFTAEAETVDILGKIISDIEGLKKWKGNLYNWYRADDKTVSIEFVSSVDSGNLIAALIIARGFLKDIKGTEELRSRIKKIIDNTDLEALYNFNKKLFFIGYNANTKNYEGHYDLLASESRLLSLICASKNGGENWRALLRDYAPYYGNTLYSWGGTAFEYLMPDLFILPPKHSLLYTSARNAVKIQRKHKTYGLFGLSESGYYAFDDALRYQYRAFGVEDIALGRDKEKRVISPYSSFLALHYSPKCVVKNLQRLEKKGVLSDYGFYEAIDLEGKPRLLQSYMTHHQGMSLAAMCNYLTGGKLRKYFMSDYSVEAASLLLTESREKRYYHYRLIEKQPRSVDNAPHYYVSCDKIEYSTLAVGLTDGSICSYCDARGGGYTMWNQRLINRFTKGITEAGARHFYVRTLSGIASPTYATMGGNPEDYSFCYTPVNASYFNSRHNIKLDLIIENNLGAEICKLTFEKETAAEVAFYEPLALASYDAANAHPVFNNFFVETTFDRENNAIIAKRRARHGESPMYVAYVARGFAQLNACCDRFTFVGRGRSEKNPIIFSEGRTMNAGEKSLEPCAAFYGIPASDTVEIIKLAAGSLEALKKKIADLPSDYYNFALEIGENIKLEALTNRLLFPLISLPYANDALAQAEDAGKTGEFLRLADWRKLIIYEYEPDNASQEALTKLIKSIDELRFFGLRPSLVVVMPDDAQGAYSRSAERLIASVPGAKVIAKADLDGVLSDCGFIVLDKRLACPDFFNLTLPPKDFVSPEKKASAVEDYYIKTGNGGFSDKNGSFVYELPLAGPPALPYSNVVCGEFGGFVATESGGGFVYFGNSHENCALRFDNDPVKDIPWERVCVAGEKGLYRINGGQGTTDKVKITLGKITYYSSFENTEVITESYILDRGAVKITEIRILPAETHKRLKLVYSFTGTLGWERNCPFVFCENISRTAVKMKNLLNGQEIYISLLSGRADCSDIEIRADWNNCVISCALSGSAEVYIAVGLKEAVTALNPADIPIKKSESLMYFESLNKISISTPDKSLDMLFNHSLLYQVVSSRLNGKCGYYQAGGATGFRDQLQDTLALLQNDPLRVKAQILYHAGRQYKEGDVMHWWHHPYYGLRTKISDDKLFLPYLTAEYVFATGDKSILVEEIPYLESPELGENEYSRYEAARVSDESGTLMQHCLRAIKSALKYGEHSLLLLGTGDWNDGLDFIGERGRAESVMLSMFAYETMRKFGELCEPKIKTELFAISERLKAAIENFAYDGKQYMRLFGDDGRWYGSQQTPCFTVDLVSQSMAVISGVAPTEREESAMDSARTLVDEQNGIIKLLAPPLDEDNYLGYISAYPAGIRENGGQYTHAAVWYIMALLRLGRAEEAYKMLKMINPISKCRDRLANASYKGEPYVLSGDVYSGKYAGRMGWSWYTGSAAWMYKVILEEFFGVKRKGGRLYIRPRLPDELNMSVMEYRWEGGVIRITFKKTGNYRLIADGLPLHAREFIRLEDNHSEVVAEY